MPCYTEPPSHREKEERRLNAFLDEIGDTRQRARGGNIYGAMRDISLDEATQALCAWSQANDVTQRSLEFQIWWRDHQAWDTRRIADEQAEAERAKTRAEALAKLTNAERKALGFK